MRDTFRRNLETALRAAIKSSATIARLLDIFNMAGSGGALTVIDRTIAIYLGGQTDIFATMKADLRRVLDEGVNSGLITEAESKDLADVVVRTLENTLSEVKSSERLHHSSPEDIFYYFLIPNEIRRRYNVRVFLAFFGIVVIAVVIFAFIEPDPWLNPATGVFILLGYFTLLATTVVHNYSSTRSE